MYQAAVATPSPRRLAWRRHLVRAAGPPPPPLAPPPLALRRPPPAAGSPVRLLPLSLMPLPLPTHRPQLACRFPAFQKVHAPPPPQYAGHHPRASPPEGRSYRRPWRCRVPTAARPPESAARLRSWRQCTARLPPLSGARRDMGSAYRGQCRYTYMVVSDMPAHAAQCSRPSGPTLPYALARPPFVRACTCQRAIAGGVASCSLCRYHALAPLAVHCRYRRSMPWCHMVYFVSAVLIAQDAAVVRGHLLLRPCALRWTAVSVKSAPLRGCCLENPSQHLLLAPLRQQPAAQPAPNNPRSPQPAVRNWPVIMPRV
jgi:hypothetical protein